MKNYTITLFILLIDLSFNDGHTLAKIELNNNADEYEVKEGKSSVTITHPKDDQPTLREVVYLHVIEKPYDSGYDEIKPESDDDNDLTEQLEKRRNNENDKNEHNNENDNHNDNDDDDENDDDSDNNSGNDADKNDGHKDKLIETTESNVNENDRVLSSNDEDANKNTTDTSYSQSEVPDIDVKFGDDDSAEVNGDSGVTEADHESRKKREIDYSNLRDAPALPEFKWNILPDYIKSILSLDPETNKEQSDSLEEQIEETVRDLEKAANHPPSHEKDNKTKKSKAKTYGMSLAGDRGEVWNDVNAGHLSYHVGEHETVKSTTSKPEVVPTTTTTVTTDESTETNNNNNEDKNGSSDENTDLDKFKDIEDSFNEIDKLLDELIKASGSSEETTKGNEDDSTKKPDGHNDRTTKAPTGKSTTEAIKSTSKDKDDEDNSITEKPNKSEDNNKLSDRKDNKDKHNNEDSKQKEFVKELMKNKYFWQWLEDSTTAYLKTLIPKLDILIKSEVEKQIEQYFKEHKNVTNIMPDTTQSTTTDKPDEAVNVTGETETKTTQKPNTTTEKPNSTSEKPIETSTELNNTASNNTKTNEPIKNNNKTEEMERKNKNKDSDKEKEAPVIIKANHVYGSSAGNGKVTNIFIFNVGKDSDLGNIKPISNGTDGIFVFGLDQDKEKEDNHIDTKNTTPKPTTDQDSNKSNQNKPDKNQVSTEKPETVTKPVDEKSEKNNEDSTPENKDIATEKPTTASVESEEKLVDKELFTSTTEKSSTAVDKEDKDNDKEETADEAKEENAKKDGTDTDKSTINAENDSSKANNEENDKTKTEGTDENTTESTRDSADVNADKKKTVKKKLMTIS